MYSVLSYRILLASLLGCFFFISCENDEQEVDRVSKKMLGIEEATNIRINYTSGGKIKSVLTAPLMWHVQDTASYFEFPNTLQADFYNDSGKIESVLTARYGKYKETQSLVFLRDSVKVINIQKGDTLYCEELNWDRQRKGMEFFTDKPVKIRTKTQVLNGIGMEASQDFNAWHILEPKGTVEVRDLN
ncbi:MAG: LPS export ABC transporter periplasmic protein LptC [Chitinophagaceae bacterium]|nr:LPS export ABC transporter periplasmic protein LptC [Chitinophagaceae bacterium]